MEASIEAIVGSIAAVAVMIALAFILGFRSNRRLAGENDVRELTTPHGGAREFLQDSRGGGVLALLQDGRFLAAKVMGNQVVTRVFAPNAIQSVKFHKSRRAQSLRVLLKFEDFSFPTLHLETKDEDPPAWLESFRGGGKPQ